MTEPVQPDALGPATMTVDEPPTVLPPPAQPTSPIMSDIAPDANRVQSKRISVKQDIPAEFLPSIAASSMEPGIHTSFSSQEARRSLASARASNRVSVQNPYENAPTVAVNIDDGSVDSANATEVYYVDSNTGKAMVRKSMVHKGRPAEITMEVSPEGEAINVVSGTARLPGETNRQYFRQMSSFARWQLHDSPGTKGIRWEGDQKHPYFCILVIIVTGIMLCVEIGVNQGIEPFAINPTFGPRRDVLLSLGAKRTDLIQKGDFYRLIAPWWLHGGILHWVVNMLALINIGFSLEREFGTPKITIIFCVCGFMGVLSSAIFLPHIVGVGASGAIFGLFGACFADVIQNWGLYKSRGNARSVLCQLIFGAVLNFLMGFLPVLDQFAHLGGFFTGISLGFVLLLQKRYTRFGEEKTVKRRQRFLQVFGAISVLATMITFLVLLYNNVNPKGWCSFCPYLNCFPIQGLWTCDDSGCSDDPIVQGFYYPNSTMQVICPTSATIKSVYTTINAQPTPQDVVQACQLLCFP